MKDLHKHINWDLLAKHFSEETSSAEEQAISNWLKADTNNFNEYQQLKEDWEMMAMSRENNKHFDADAAWNKFEQKISGEKTTTASRLFLYGALKYAATVLLLAALSIGGYFIYQQVQFQNNYEVFASEENEIGADIILDDGTKVWLDENSKLIYPKSFDNGERKVELIGEAFFDVARNEEKPFLVTAKKSSIKVLGTTFNVNTQLPGERVEVFVETGKVELLSKKKQKVVLEPGFIGISEKEQLEKHKNEDPNYLSWRSGKLVFRGEPLDHVLKSIERHYNTTIRFDEDMKKFNFTVQFEKEPLDTVLEVICKAFPVKKEKEEDSYILTVEK